MNLTCVICTDLFSPSDDVYITPCGHMFHHVCLLQWLERSKTCPQCRNKCLQKQMHKVFFNLANLDNSRADIGSLRQELDDCNLKQSLIQREVENREVEIKELRATQKKCLKTITSLEKKIHEDKFLISSHIEHISRLTPYQKLAEQYRKENLQLNQKIEQMNSVQALLNSTTNEVETLLEDNQSRDNLAIWVLTLKRELKALERKHSDLKNKLKTTQNEARRGKEDLEDKIKQLESELYEQMMNNKPKETNVSTNSIAQDLSSPTLNITNAISKRVKLIEESNSPYLNIKSSSVGLQPLLKNLTGQKKFDQKNLLTKKSENIYEDCASVQNLATGSSTLTMKKATSDLSEKYSIFKKPRLLCSRNSNLAFDGLGGSRNANFAFNALSGLEKRSG